MKKTIVTFGLISGAIMSLMMVVSLPFIDRVGFDRAEILGYTTIVLSFLLVYFGIRSYRDNAAGGTISFGRAFQVGILITLTSCVCYVVTWEILYFTVLHGFMERYAAYAMEQANASGASPESIQAQLGQINRMKELYRNPFFNVAITFIEPFPIGLIMTLISAAILRKKPPSLLAPARIV